MSIYRVELNKEKCQTDSLILKLYTNKAFLLPTNRENSFIFEVNNRNKKATVTLEVDKNNAFKLAGDSTVSIYKDNLLVDKIRVERLGKSNKQVLFKVNRDKLKLMV